MMYTIIFLLTLVYFEQSTSQPELLPPLATVLKSNCRIFPGINSPTEFLGYPTQVTLILYAVRLLGINDVDETFALDAGITVSWANDCVREVFESGQYPIPGITNGSDFNIYLPMDEVWHPKIMFVNGAKQKTLQGDDFSSGLMYTFPTHTFMTAYYGKIQGYCDLDFYNFPYDW